MSIPRDAPALPCTCWGDPGFAWGCWWGQQVTHSRVPREERWNVPSLPAPCWIVPSTSGTWVLGSAAPPAGTLRPPPVSRDEGHSWEWAGRDTERDEGEKLGERGMAWRGKNSLGRGCGGHLGMGRVGCWDIWGWDVMKGRVG